MERCSGGMGARGSTWRGRGGDHKPFLLSAPGRLVHWGPCQENVSGKSGQKQVPSVKRVALASSSFQGRHRYLVHRAGGRHCGSCRRRCRLRRAVARRWGAVTGREGVAVRAEHAREGARGCLQRGKRSRAGKAKKTREGTAMHPSKQSRRRGPCRPPRARQSHAHDRANPTQRRTRRVREPPHCTHRRATDRSQKRTASAAASDAEWDDNTRGSCGGRASSDRSAVRDSSSLGPSCRAAARAQGGPTRRGRGGGQGDRGVPSSSKTQTPWAHTTPADDCTLAGHAQQPSKRAHPPCPRRRPAAACRAHAPWGHV